MSHLFFFSYARATLKYASGYNHQTGDRYNLLELLYEELVQLVHQAEGGDASDIGYFDQIDLAIGDPWPERLATAAATSKVLVAIITPSYLQSSNCGREFRAFLDRYAKLTAASHGPRPAAPIILLYFEDQVHCWRHTPQAIRPFFEATQYRQAGLPADYPVRGYRKILELDHPRIARQILFSIRDRICQLKDLALPPLDDDTDFRTLPDAFLTPAISPSPPDMSLPPVDIAGLPPARPLPAMEIRL